METTAQPIAIFILQPPLRSAMVAFAPEEFGFGKNVEGGNAPKESIRFADGRYEAHNAEIADMLRNHPGNGETFFEAPKEAFRHAAALENLVDASVPEEGLTEEDYELLSALDKLATKNLPEKGHRNAVTKIKKAVERFRVANFRIPSADKKTLIIRARAAELLDILAEQGITDERGETA
jgi:hypothetical protein